MQLMPDISQKVLTTQLRELEADRLINRQSFPESPPRVEYSVTEYGKSLQPITEMMCDWGKANSPEFQFGLMCLRGLRILAIAQTLLTQKLQAELGELRGADVIATSLVIASKDLREMNPDIVLIDFSLNENFETLQQQLESSGKALSKSIPAIALTANNQERDRALSQGFSVHLMEPVEISELVAAIANLTGRLA